MKLSTTTPASNSIFKRATLVFGALMIIIASIHMLTPKAFADQYDDRINALQQQIAQFKAEQARLNSEAMTLQSALDQLSNERATIQAQIDISQAKHDKLVAQIAETEKKIKDNQDALGQTIANMYVDDKITPIEMLASSKNISEFIDKQEYRSSVRDQLINTITKIKALKAQLVKDRTDVAKVLADQKSQRDQLIAKENEKQGLLDQTHGQDAAYQRLINDNQAAIIEARATQALLNSRINGSGGYTLIDSGSLGDYPWNSSNCPMWGYLSTGGADGNGGDGRGYGCRQCASYVAWRFAKETGIYPRWGDAKNFTYGATSLGYQEGGPQAGSIAVMDPSTAGNSYGHVAWVESSNGDGSIIVSQYNYNYGAGFGMYSMMRLSANAFDHYIHIK